tara:strand:+ start:120 stop:800 length:681 start_codon:yes stop_codon:yes gene_type:complete
MDRDFLRNVFEVNSTPNSPEILLFVIALVLSVLFSYLLRYFYISFWNTIADKENISSNFVLLTLIITIIITVVKSSLALSLGLVGALSIVRFRTPIKDPEELIFLFICIALGLSLGAYQFSYASIGFAFVIGIILFKSKFQKKDTQHNFFLSIHDKNFDVQKFMENSGNLFDSIVLKKVEESVDSREVILNMRLKKNVSFKEFDDFLKENNIKNYTYFDQDNFFQN